MSLALPKHLIEETQRYGAELELQAMAVLADEVKHWTKELKEVDENLELVWAPENVTHPALVPGRFHIIEHRGLPTPPNVIPLVGDDNEYREPGSWMFEMLRQGDHWSSRSMKIREEKAAKAEAARNRAIAREKEETAAELDDRIKHILRPQVSMYKGDRPWAYRAHASRDKRR
jgi:hypothetical protein